MVALDALEQLDADSLHLIAPTLAVTALPAASRYASRKPSEKARMVSRATSRCSNRIAPSRDERQRGMQLVGAPAQGLELLARRRAIGGLAEQALSERQRLVGAEHEPARAPLQRLALSPGRATPRSPPVRSSRRALRCRARRYRPGTTSSGMPALSSTARRTALFEASTSG